jgi:hypothetical protein
MSLRPDLLDALPVVIDGYELLGHAREGEWLRRTTEIHLHGAGETGKGEDVVYDADLQGAQQDAGPILPLAGTWKLGDLFDQLAELDLFGGATLEQPVYARYRRWAFESAAADLALRQDGRSLATLLERPPRPIGFVVSPRLGDPVSLDGVHARLEAFPGMRFKLDAGPGWDDAFLAGLAATGAVATVDFKGAYVNTPVDVETDPDLYARVAAAFLDAWLEDPDLTDAAAAAALAPFMDRVTWDAPIHTVEELEALPVRPRAINVKPSRIGSWRELLAVYAWCERHRVEMYGGGQSELGVGRGQIQYLASLMHPDTPNDIAPAGLDQDGFAGAGLPASPLPPDFEPTGFRRRS